MDVRNTPVSIENADLLSAYEGALVSFQTFVGEPVSQLNKILAEEPEFMAAHLFRAIAFYLSSEQRFLAPAQDSVANAEALLDTANEREQMLFHAVRHLVGGRWEVAGRALDAVLQAYPRDVLALQTGHLLDFFRGDAQNLRNRPARVLPDWSPDTPGYSYVLGMYAFGLEECNQYAQAEEVARQALAIQPVDPWSVHAVTHVMEMMGRSQEGIRFLQEREADWAGDNGFAYHNWWHLCLLYLEQEEDQRVLEIYDQSIVGGGEITLALLDATALLWRLKLLGLDVGDRFKPLADLWAAKLDAEAGYYAFNDFHAALAFCAVNDGARIESLAEHLRHYAGADNPANVEMSQAVGLPLVQGVQAYGAGRFADAAQLFGQVRDVAHRFGGSHAQRDIINLTLLGSAKKAGQDTLVRYLMNERQMLKPSGVLGLRVLQAA